MEAEDSHSIAVRHHPGTLRYRTLVTGLQAALWGLLGSGVAEALSISRSMHPSGPHRMWRWPWDSKADRPMMLVAIGLRLFAGCGLAAALWASGYLNSETAALAAGVATPLIVARLFQFLPLHDENSAVGESVRPATLNGDALSTDGRSDATR
ncbi:hypothetical protein [Streptomyces paludis]|uniref:hypothetical protein n=1 Tax=Streptomyces paludis TaxID=2282738 RepID=UPI0013B46E52|nr:hypothetical protein [Streptomyces paludis]